MQDQPSTTGAGGEGVRSALVLYQTEDGATRIQCRFEGESIWLTQALIAELFGVKVHTVNEHLKNIYGEGEVAAEATIRSFRMVRSEGTRQVARDIEHYSLEAILAVGYRVRSPRGTQFRQWATARLAEFLVKGFTMDDARLKNPPGPGVPDYFDELLERIRDIRASERRMYTRVRDILALAADYAPSAEATQAVFFTVQNKLHHAVTGMTAPELIAERVDAQKPNMGLTTWAGDAVRRADVTVAKNYLREDEIAELNRIVVMFLDFAEDQARRKKQVFLRDWPVKLDEFLQFNERAVLGNAGKVKREEADAKAIAEYERFEVRRREVAEAAGAAESLRALEEAAKKLPKRKPRRGDRGKGGGDGA
ncbi:MAG: virulence RhuM family protein [Phycisphaerales bacterium]|nr:virulence RhuM family protein [Phycisphaerales bacterium]